MSTEQRIDGLYGLMAEFETPEQLLEAASKTHAKGYRKIDAYTPLPVEGLSAALGVRRTGVPAIVLTFGMLGALGGFALCYWISVIVYPLNVGGRPLNSWPAYIPITFECAILLGSLSAVIGMFALNGLPMPYHPVFNASRFRLASRDRFFLCIEATDPLFDPDESRMFLMQFSPREVVEVAR
jgi:hypothetical protein